jgi:proteasome lid subunit RPN8/RPN11
MFSPSTILAARQHALAEYPKESVGLIQFGDYVELVNIHEQPEESFKVADDVMANYQIKGPIDAILHSHPNGELCPTKIDMEGQVASAVPWGIIQVTKEKGASEPVFWGDELEMAPLLGRVFVPGIHDCYSLVRDWFRVNTDNIRLPIFPRDDNWWEGENIVADNFAAMGFVQIDKIEQVGDCAIGPFMQHQVENHCAVYIGQGLLLQHFPTRLSRRDPAGPWIKRATRFFRHKDYKDA